jgi:Fe2+ or Zn2+ uptake regulation protein
VIFNKVSLTSAKLEAEMDATALDAELTGLLRSRGQRVTPQRLVLHRLVRAHPRHLTAEELLERSRAALPNVALPTVYATLDLFAELGVVRRVPGTGPAQVYDTRADQHHHVRCSACGRVADLDVAIDGNAAFAAARAQGFVPDRAEVVVTGRCAACAAR